MEWTITYIVSQVFTIVMYALLALTYYTKERKTILILCFFANVFCGISYFLLGAWSGLSMCFLAIFRDSVNLIEEKKNGKREKINQFDIFFLIFLYAICIVSAIFTYEGFLSLLSILATMIYTYSIWQKKTQIYKICGIPTGVLWILYNIYVQSLFGVILESIIFICSIVGYLLEVRSKKEHKNEVKQLIKN